MTDFIPFKTFCRTRLKLAESTISRSINYLKIIERNNIYLQHYTEDDIYHLYETWMKSKNNACINAYTVALNQWGKYRENGITIQSYPTFQKPIKVHTIDEIHRIIEVYDDKTPLDKLKKTVIVLLANTGMRAGELCGLTLDCIDWERKEITVYGKGHGERKPRIIPLSNEMLDGKTYPSIRNYISTWRYTPKTQSRHILFINSEGRGISTLWVWLTVNKAGEEAGVPGIHPHSFRHFYATNLLRNGVPVHVAQRILGHEQLATTGKYLHLVGDDLHKAVRAIDDPVYEKTKVVKKMRDLAEKTDKCMKCCDANLCKRIDRFSPRSTWWWSKL